MMISKEEIAKRVIGLIWLRRICVIQPDPVAAVLLGVCLEMSGPFHHCITLALETAKVGFSGSLGLQICRLTSVDHRRS